MPDSNKDIMPNSGFKADNFDKEKETADKIEEQKKSATDTDIAKEQEILKEQKETD